MKKEKAVFLDRDGVINQYPGDAEYVKSWQEFHFLPDIRKALKKLNDNGFKIFIVSNQAGVSKGLYSQESLDLITKNMLDDFKNYQIDICGVYYCVHRTEDNCACRKPKAGLINIAAADLKKTGLAIDFKASYFIGDTIRDIETGRKAGLMTILVFSGKEKPENKDNWQSPPDFTARDLSEAAEIILNHK